MPATYTHVAQKIHTGYRHVSNRLAGHTAQRPGRRHAVNAEGRGGYRAVCGEYVAAEQVNEWGGDEAAPVCPAADGRVTCRRCLARKPVPTAVVIPMRRAWVVIGTAGGVDAAHCSAGNPAAAERVAAAVVRPQVVLGREYPPRYESARVEERDVPAATVTVF